MFLSVSVTLCFKRGNHFDCGTTHGIGLLKGAALGIADLNGSCFDEKAFGIGVIPSVFGTMHGILSWGKLYTPEGTIRGVNKFLIESSGRFLRK